MIKFDYIKARDEDYEVFTRDGRKVQSCVYLPEANDDCKIAAVIDGTVHSRYVDGSIYPPYSCEGDLFMKEMPKRFEAWVIPGNDGGLGVYYEETEAKIWAAKEGCEMHHITWEVEE